MKAEELGGDPAGEYGGGEEAEAMIALCEATIRALPSERWFLFWPVKQVERATRSHSSSV